MKNSRGTHLKSLLLALLIITGTICSTPTVAAPADDPLLNMLPADCLACLRINDLNGTLGKMDQYLAGASPIPMSLMMVVNMQLGMIVGDPMATGIDKTGAFAVFAMPAAADDPMGIPSFGILVPMVDYKAFVETNPNIQPGQNGYSILASANSPAGNLLLSPVPGNKYALVVPEFEQAVLPALQNALTSKTSARISKRLHTTQAQEAVSAPLWIYANIALIYEKYEPMLMQTMEMTSQMSAMQPGAPGQSEFKMLQAILKEFAGDMDSITVAMTPSPSVLTIDKTFRAKTGSELAQILVSDPKAANGFKFSGYLDNNTAVNGLLKINKPMSAKLNDKMVKAINAAIENPELAAQTKDIIEMSKAAMAAMGDEIAFSFSYAAGMPPIQLREVIAVTDDKIFEDASFIQKGLDYSNAMYKAMNMPMEIVYTPDKETYKDVKIGVVGIKMPVDESMDEQAQAMMAQMYGASEAMYYFAQGKGKMYITMGPDALNEMKALIDTAGSSTPAGDIKMAMDALQNTPYTDLVCSVNVIKLFKSLGDMMEGMSNQFGGAQGIPSPIPNVFAGMNVQSQSTMTIGGKIADGQASFRAALPKQHLAEIITAAMQIQQKAMAMQSQMQQQGMTGQGTEPSFGDSTDPAEAQDPAEVLLSWIGKKAPELKMIDLQGNIHRVSRLKGKKVVLDFWATWCPPCKKAIPHLIELRKQYDENKVVILGLSNEPIDRLNQFIKEQQINYPIISYNDEPAAPYGQVTVLPTVFLIDADGVIQNVLLGYSEETEVTLDEFLQD